jgi:hypothetical protein
LKEFNRELDSELKKVKGEIDVLKNDVRELVRNNGKIVEEIIFDFVNKIEMFYSLNRNHRGNEENYVNKFADAPLKIEENGRTDKIFRNSNSHLFERLEKMEKLVLTLK